MDKQQTIVGLRQARQVLRESVENGTLDSILSWKLQRVLQIAEGAVSSIAPDNELFAGIKIPGEKGEK